jgi:hypothetical protein
VASRAAYEEIAMNLSSNRRCLVPWFGAGVLLMVAGAAPARAASSGVDAELLSMQHEAELQSGEKLQIAYHRRKESNYRVCIPQPGEDLVLKFGRVRAA